MSDAHDRCGGGYLTSSQIQMHAQRAMYQIDKSSQAQFHETVPAVNVSSSLKMEEHHNEKLQVTESLQYIYASLRHGQKR